MLAQLLVEVISNLSGEQQEEAWHDLATASGERQRVAGQLVASLEGACVLLAGALQQSPPRSSSAFDSGAPAQLVDFHKSSEFVYVAVHSFPLLGAAGAPLNQGAQAAAANGTAKFQVTFPQPASVLGTKWMNSEQRFTLNLQAAPGQESEPGKLTVRLEEARVSAGAGPRHQPPFGRN